MSLKSCVTFFIFAHLNFALSLFVFATGGNEDGAAAGVLVANVRAFADIADRGNVGCFECVDILILEYLEGHNASLKEEEI